MDLRDLVKLAGIVNPELLNRIDATPEVEEADGGKFELATTAPDEQVMDDPMQSMGSDVDTSLRRYLKARGDHVTVDEEVYPDHTVDSVSEAYASFKEGYYGKKKKYNEAEEAEECKYCGGDCPNDEDNACDGYSGDIDGLYEERAKANESAVEEGAEDRARYDADETPRGEKRKKVSLKKAPWEKDDDDKEKTDEHSDLDRLRTLSGTPSISEDQGKVGYMEMFFTDRDGGEVSQEVEVTLKDGKLDVTGPMPGPEDDLYWDDADIEEQLRDAMQDMSSISWLGEDTIDEADIEENAFNQAAAAAARAGKDSFEFGGKTHKTTMKKDTAHKLDDDIDVLRQLAGL